MRPTDTVFRNARIVTKDEIVAGSLAICNGCIASVNPETSSPALGEDWDGDLLLPGLVELHTDNLEKHIAPRPGVWWPIPYALHSHTSWGTVTRQPTAARSWLCLRIKA